MRDLNCGANALGALDVADNGRLELLLCGGNDIASLDLARCAALRRLVCGDNLLTALDVAGNTALEELECYGNDIDVIALGRNPRLSLVDCRYNALSPHGIEDIFRALPRPSADMHATIAISDNPGAGECDTSIAEAKNWRVDVN